MNPRTTSPRPAGGRWCASSLCLAIIAVASTAGAQTPAAIPPDFRVSLRSGPLRPGDPEGPQSVTVDATGRATLSAVQRPDEKLPERQIQLSPAALRRIYDAVVKERFFELRPLYREARIRDGDFAEIEVVVGGRSHRVRTVNMRVFAFDRIAVTIDRELPKGRRVQYNALHVDEYPAVER